MPPRSAPTPVEGFGDVITVTTYGARGDGIADDRRAIQLAIDEAGKRPSGGVVVFPAGTFPVSAPVLLHSRVTMLGLGFFPRYGWYANAPTLPVTIRPGRGFIRGGSVLDARHAANTHVEGIEVLGDGSIGPDQTDATTTGIAYGTADLPNSGSLWSNHLLRNCSVVGHRIGVHGKEASYNWWDFNNVAVCWQAGVLFEAWCGDSTLLGTYVNRCNASLASDADPKVGYGLFLGHGSANTNIIGGKIENNGRGFQISETWGVNVVGVNFHNNAHYHIGVFGGSRPATSIQLSSSRFLGGGGALAGRGSAHLRLEAAAGAHAAITVSGCGFKAGPPTTAVDYDASTPRGPDHLAWAAGAGIISLLFTGNDCADGATMAGSAGIHFESSVAPQSRCVGGPNLGEVGYNLMSGTLQR